MSGVFDRERQTAARLEQHSIVATKTQRLPDKVRFDAAVSAASNDIAFHLQELYGRFHPDQFVKQVAVTVASANADYEVSEISIPFMDQ